MSRWRSMRDDAGARHSLWQDPRPGEDPDPGADLDPERTAILYPQCHPDEQDATPRRVIAITGVGLVLAGSLAGTYFAVAGGLGALVPGPGAGDRPAPVVRPGAPVVAPSATPPAAWTPPARSPATASAPPATVEPRTNGTAVGRPVPAGPAPSSQAGQGCDCRSASPSPSNSASPTPSPSATGIGSPPPDPAPSEQQ